MSDLIDRQAVIRLVHSVLYEMMVDAAATDIEKPMSKEDKLLVKVNQIVCTKLRKMPSAQPEIIRCKDCFHYPGEYSDCPMIGWFRHDGDYCSRAERRTDE